MDGNKRGGNENLIEDVANGKIAMYKVDELTSPEEAVTIRRKAIEKIANVSLEAVASSDLDYSAIANKNAENVIGSVQIPLGVAGPISVNGKYAKGSFYVPMATTEGALIASVNRGMKAITSSGGATAIVLKDAMARAPVFWLPSITKVDEFLRWLDSNKAEIIEVAEETTKHGKIKSIEPFVIGNNVWLRFSFDTGDAMGMNMVTIATEAACSYIEESTDAKCVAVSGNMCSDKKESAANSLLGRGKTVVAEALISKDVLEGTLKSSAVKANDVNLRKNLLGSARAGSTKYNGHFANMVAAIFAATGQDIAQVVESSSGYTWTEVRGDDLYISVTLTSLEIGTVGGGTSLKAQHAALSIMQAAGGGSVPGHNSAKFAEIISAAVLAGELNLLCALSNRELGRAHKRLGRNIK